MTRPARDAGKITALMGQQAGIAAVRFDERIPGPVDCGRDQGREKTPSPGRVGALDRQ